jgi:hypothetical protein
MNTYIDPNGKVESFLRWLRASVHIAFSVITILSRPLILMALVISSFDFNSQGQFTLLYPEWKSIWMFSQAIGIDSSIGVTCYNMLGMVKKKEWLQAILLFLLLLSLLWVAGFTNFYETYAQGMGTNLSDRTIVDLPVDVISIARTVAMIGFLLSAAFEDFTFKDALEAGHTVEKAIATKNVDILEGKNEVRTELVQVPLVSTDTSNEVSPAHTGDTMEVQEIRPEAMVVEVDNVAPEVEEERHEAGTQRDAVEEGEAVAEVAMDRQGEDAVDVAEQKVTAEAPINFNYGDKILAYIAEHKIDTRLKLTGAQKAEIASFAGCSTKTVERKMQNFTAIKRVSNLR